MRSIIQYTQSGLQPKTRAWGEAHGAEFVDTGFDDEANYWLLARLWRDGEAFMLIDHDIVPPVGAIEALASCGEPVCAFPFLADSSQFAPAMEEIGCTRFSRALIRAHRLSSRTPSPRSGHRLTKLSGLRTRPSGIGSGCR